MAATEHQLGRTAVQAFEPHAEIPATEQRSHSTRPAYAEPLTLDEKQLLLQCESRILQCLMAFFDVGKALLTIRDQRLYRGAYKTLDEYCQQRLHISRFYAYRLMAAAQVVEGLLTRVNTLPPQTEAQVRPLIG